MKIIPIIISGGIGTRLWPLSTEEFPKQFHSFINGKTLLQETTERVLKLKPEYPPIFITQEKYRFLVSEQIKDLCGDAKIILEPEGRNTAPAVAAASHYVKTNFIDSIIVVFPSDHFIGDEKAFRRSIESGIEAAKSNKIVTFGVKPTEPNTGYGYIEKGNKNNLNSFQVISFHEKPHYEKAKEYVTEGSFLWNSGIYMFKPGVMLKELLVEHSALVTNTVASVDELEIDSNFLRLDKKQFMRNKSISIDSAVMEKTESSVLTELDCDWSDLGSWNSIYKRSKKDLNNNTIGEGVYVEETKNSYIRSDKRKITVIGLEDLLVIDTENDLLIASKSKMDTLRIIPNKVDKDNFKDMRTRRKVLRPWGSYIVLDQGKNFLVKKIIVNVNSKLSLQKHKHRAENWVVIQGKAKVTCEEDVSFLEKNTSIYIPVGAKHRLENIGDTALEIIEVQSGDYLSEDDIERFEDDYNR